MGEEGSKTLVIVGTVLGALCALACLAGSIFFLFVGTVSRSTAAVSVTASATTPAAALMVAVLPDGGVLFEGAQVTDAELKAQLEERFASGGDARVVLAADENTPYARVVGLIDLSKQAGFTRVALGVGKK